VVLTGRYAPKELIERADAVNEIVEIKYPREMITQRGIQY
jgi:ATP:corrinoid adenosyltransferase